MGIDDISEIIFLFLNKTCCGPLLEASARELFKGEIWIIPQISYLNIMAALVVSTALKSQEITINFINIP